MKVCIYHGSDLDGQCSGAIYADAHKGEEFVLMPMDYGDQIPWEELKGSDVTLIDFSFQPWSEFERLMHESASVTWIDHHKSAIKEYQQTESDGKWCPMTVVLDETKAACELAWEYYHPETEMPIAVHLLGRYDVWDHTDERVMPFQYGLRVYKLDPLNGKDRAIWTDLLSTGNSPGDILHVGRSILTYQRQNAAAAVAANWFPVSWEGKRWQACNRLGRGSTFFDSIWNPAEYDGMLSFFWTGKVWEIGLYTDRKDVDCGAIAKRHGGGGHPGAAGCRADVLPFLLREGYTIAKV